MQLKGFITKRTVQSGFTLIEVIIGIVALSISLAIVTSLIVPTEQKSADQIHQVKAAELAQSLMNEIMGKAFDNNSDMAGGRDRCDETDYSSCTVLLGAEGAETRATFNDVDDYDEYNEKVSSTGENLHSGYNTFSIFVDVSYDNADILGLGKSPKGNALAKLIQITVTTPLGTDITFASYKANF